MIAAAIGCHGRGATLPPPVDPHSFAEPDRVAVKDLTLDLTVDFTTKKLTGTARLQLDRHDRHAPLMLDDDGLTIASVNDCAGAQLKYRVGDKIGIGAPLRIELGKGDCVVIAYSTSPDAGALLWVEPSGTAGKTKPMLFTQSQSIYARTWIPLQDTPSIRFTYSATIHAPAGMWALMSGENPRELVPDGVWHIVQKLPIPSYLMALAVGDFTFRPIGARTGVYAEPSIADAAAKEFSEVEQMVAAAEKLYGPYRWGRYDMLVLPPSFPYGGMENPNLTFLTPTVLSGDRALVGLIAHELAHSWSGNLVTNKTWNDSWLNEGITTYVERRIMEELRGKDYADLMWVMGFKDITEAMTENGFTSEGTKLAHAFGRDTNPEDIPSYVEYDKGALFMHTLEVTYGRPAFDTFLHGWFERHAFQPVDSRMFADEAKSRLGTKVAIDDWIFQPGLPKDAVHTTSKIVDAVEHAEQGFNTQGTLPDASAWTTQEWIVFLRALPDAVSADKLQALDAAFHLTNTTNAEISMIWLPRLVEADVKSGEPAIDAFLSTVGRRRMVMPIYGAMVDKGGSWLELAKKIFERAKPLYHPITRDSIAKRLAGTPEVR